MFNSLLFLDYQQQPPQIAADADFLNDLHLDQLLGTVRQQLAAPIAATLLQPLSNRAEIAYRQQVFTDLHQPAIREALATFATTMHRLDAQRIHLPHLFSAESRWINLVAVLGDTEDALTQLTTSLQAHSLTSQALLGLRTALQAYAQAPGTRTRLAAIAQAKVAVTNLTYRLEFHGRKVTVSAPPKAQATLSDQLAQTFQAVMQSPQDLKRDIQLKEPEPVGRLNNLQISVVNQLVKLYPAEFAVLQKFEHAYGSYQPTLFQRVAQEATFYLGWWQLEDRIQKALHVNFCLPTIITSGPESATASFDFDLAHNLLTTSDAELVTNDFRLAPTEQFLIISGPNQGGKTTYARMVGELVYLCRLGIPIPGTQATFKVRPKLATHFDRQESSQPLTGLLANDIDRIHQIIQAAVPGELVIMNELFSSTATQDAEALATQVLQRLTAKQAIGIYVTFLSSLADFPGTVSMMSQVTSDSRRTYKVVRQAIDDHAYATVLLARYQLTQSDLEGGTKHAR